MNNQSKANKRECEREGCLLHKKKYFKKKMMMEIPKQEIFDFRACLSFTRSRMLFHIVDLLPLFNAVAV